MTVCVCVCGNQVHKCMRGCPNVLNPAGKTESCKSLSSQMCKILRRVQQGSSAPVRGFGDAGSGACVNVDVGRVLAMRSCVGDPWCATAPGVKLLRLLAA